MSASETFRFAPPYQLPSWPFVPPPELADGTPRRHRLVIAGAGLTGLTLACDLAARGVDCVVLDEDDTVGVRGASSRGICYAQKSLEIYDRLGIVDRIVGKGVTWSLGRTFCGDDEVYNFELKSTGVSRQPPFVNLQQFYLEWFLVDRILELGHAELRWKNRITAVEARAEAVRVTVQTPAGDYTIDCDWLIDATGANSPIRRQLGLEARTSHSADRWCITDVRFDRALAIERWTWVSAPFNDGRGVWQHLMADDVWRMDYQMPLDADPEEISRPEVAGQRIRRQLGPDVTFEFVWIGPYQYRDLLLDRFRHGRVLFMGDSAHVVSPFGARGGNTGIQDANNLGWKFALVLAGQAPERLLESYDAERRAAATENLQVTSRTARFLAPRTAAERTIRDALLTLARRYPFARTMVNTGRMSVANDYPASEWLPAGGKSLPNVPLVDGGGRRTTLMALLRGTTRLLALHFASPEETAAGSAVAALRDAVASLPVAVVDVHGPAGLAAGSGGHDDGRGSGKDRTGANGDNGPSDVVLDRDHRLRGLLAAAPGSIVLVRPDAYCAARLEAADPGTLARAVRTALGLDATSTPPTGERADAAAEV